jgi:AbrB family looped-hinge helix DNA binding protein
MINHIFKAMAKRKLNPKDFQEKIYGSTLVGARGQVVIPAEARKDLGISPGDRLVVLGKMNKALGMIKAEELTKILDRLMGDIDNIDFASVKKIAKKNMAHMLNKLKDIR